MGSELVEALREEIEALRAGVEAWREVAEGRSQRIASLKGELAEMREPVHDDPTWLRNEVRRQREVIKALYQELVNLRQGAKR